MSRQGKPSSSGRRPQARGLQRLILAALAVALPSIPAIAVEVPEDLDRGVGPEGFLDPTLRVEPTLDIYRPGSAEPGRNSPPAPRWAENRRLADFFGRHTDAWEVRWDLRSDRPHLLQGAGIPLLPGRGNHLRAEDLGLRPGREPTLADVERLLRRQLQTMEQLLGVRERDLILDLERSTGYSGKIDPGGGRGRGKYFWSMEFRQVHRGVPVAAWVFFRVNHGNVVQLGTRRLADVEIDAIPRVSREQATETVLKRLSLVPEQVEWWDRGSLEILPIRDSPEPPGQRFTGTPGQGYGHLLVWQLSYLSTADQHSYRVLVDAGSGDILEHLDLTRYATGSVSGLVFLEDNSQPAVGASIAHAIVHNDDGFPVTDEGGSYTWAEGTWAGIYFTGKYAAVEDGCGNIFLNNDPDEDGIFEDGNLPLDGVPDGTDCAVPIRGGGGNTNAARTAFYHMTKINRTAANFLPDNVLVTGTLHANTNVDDACNAFWNGAGLNFYQSGSSGELECSNAGELASVIYHEWGHALDDFTGNNILEKGSGEALADTFALLETHDPCIGNNFHPGEPCPGCNPECTGVRDLDAFSTGGISTVARPDTVTDDSGIDCDRFECPYYNEFFPYQGPMGYEGHCESLIASSANWDLARMLVSEHGSVDGWARLVALWYGGLVPAQSAYRVAQGGLCNPQAVVDGCAADNWYTVFLAVDDDDGNLLNGTPDGCRIFSAYLAHGIACGDAVACTDGCQPQPLPDAGPDRDVCLGESTTVGTPALPDHTYSWSPGGQTTAQITVTPDVTSSYVVTATTVCGSFQDEVRVVVDDGTGDGLEEDFEGAEGEPEWTTTGLWHLVSDSDCATPGYASPVSAMYYGQDETCDYKTPGANFGELISPPIFNLGVTSTLSFDYLREVESGEGGFDRVTVSVSEAGTGAWQTVWSRDSGDPSAAIWTTSDTIPLADFFGAPIQLRFRFDTVDGSFNRYTGWLVDNVVVSGSGACDLAPRVLIASPEDGASLDNGQTVELAGSALDEDGNLSHDLAWTSTLDGDLGTGSVVATTLSLGTHEITASVADSAGNVGSATVSVGVVDATPEVTVTAPADGSTFGAGEAVSFSGTAEDFEDGDLTAGLAWSSDLDGVIGSGASFTVSSLSIGTHTVVAEATDSAGNIGGGALVVSVDAVPDLPPAVMISAPADGTLAAAGTPIAFAGTAGDGEDGDLTPSLAWTSSLDGALGTGGSLSAALTTGVHTVTAEATDSAGQTGAAAITVVVTPDGAPPAETVFPSIAADDGYVRESSEDSGAGGFANSTGSGSRPIRVGDASGDRQYRSILSFDTSSIPDGAVLLAAGLRLRRGGLLGTDPFTTLGACTVDVMTGPFGGSAILAAGDFEAPATVPGSGELSAAAADLEWSEASLDAAGLAAIALDGLTQLRVAFEIDDDDNGAYDYVGYFSGESDDADSRPQLVVTWVASP